MINASWSGDQILQEKKVIQGGDGHCQVTLIWRQCTLKWGGVCVYSYTSHKSYEKYLAFWRIIKISNKWKKNKQLLKENKNYYCAKKNSHLSKNWFGNLIPQNWHIRLEQEIFRSETHFSRDPHFVAIHVPTRFQMPYNTHGICGVSQWYPASCDLDYF